VRVVLDSNLALDPALRVFATAGTLVFCAPSAPAWLEDRFKQRGAIIIRVPHTAAGLDLNAVLRELGQRDIMSVLVEGGGAVLGSFLDAGLIDRVMTFIAPKLVGGHSAPSPIGGEGISRMDQALHLSCVRHETLGDDLLIIGDVEEICSQV